MAVARAGVHRLALVGAPPEMRDWSGTSYPPLVAVGGEAITHLDDASAKDYGIQVNAFVTIDAGRERPTAIGAGSFLMTKCHVAHDCLIGDGCEIAPSASILGHAELGDGVKVGANACVKPYVKVGAGARIGMGAVVTKDVPAGEVWVGNPARRLR